MSDTKDDPFVLGGDALQRRIRAMREEAGSHPDDPRGFGRISTRDLVFMLVDRVARLDMDVERLKKISLALQKAEQRLTIMETMHENSPAVELHGG